MKKATTQGRVRQVRTAAKSGKTTTYRTEAGEVLNRVTVYIPTELHKRAKVRAISTDQNVSQLIIGLLERELSK